MSQTDKNIKQIINSLRIGLPLNRTEKDFTIEILEKYEQVLNILEPLRNYNTNNNTLDLLKDITKNTNTPSSEVICTKLPIGTLKTYDDHNACYPGVHVMFSPEDSDVEIDICAIQMHQDADDTDNKHLHVYVFDDPTRDDCTLKIQIDTTKYQLD